MTQADSVHSTPPTNTSAIDPAPSQETLARRLAQDAAKRERALKRLRKLRRKAADEIEKLLEFLNASDLDPDLEETADSEPSLGWSIGGQCGAIDDVELDDSDDEPALGSIEDHPNGYRDGSDFGHGRDQERWASGNRDDREGDEHDGREPGEDDEDGGDDEPSLLGVTANGHPTDNDLEADVFDTQQGSTPTKWLRAAQARRSLRSNLRWPSGRPANVEDLATMPSNVTVLT